MNMTVCRETTLRCSGIVRSVHCSVFAATASHMWLTSAYAFEAIIPSNDNVQQGVQHKA